MMDVGFASLTVNYFFYFLKINIKKKLKKKIKIKKKNNNNKKKGIFWFINFDIFNSIWCYFVYWFFKLFSDM